MATYKSAFSGAQMDDTFDKVLNKKITAADIGVQTYYNSLGKISSSLNTDSTPFEVANAMADKSVLILATSGSYTYAGGLIPQAENGILVIEKDSIARVSFEFIGENTGFYDSYLRSLAGNFKGWRRHYTSANKPTAADVGALPSSGGTVTGAINISIPGTERKASVLKNASASVDYGTNVYDYSTSAIYAGLNIRAISALAQVLRLIVNGTTFAVYGTHNLTVATTAPTSALANDAQVQVYDA